MMAKAAPEKSKKIRRPARTLARAVKPPSLTEGLAPFPTATEAEIEQIAAASIGVPDRRAA